MMLHLLSSIPVLADTSTGAASSASNAIVGVLKGFLGPILLAVIGIVALRFLFNHQIMQFITFVVVAILVGILFYNPQIVSTIADAFATQSTLATP